MRNTSAFLSCLLGVLFSVLGYSAPIKKDEEFKIRHLDEENACIEIERAIVKIADNCDQLRYAMVELDRDNVLKFKVDESKIAGKDLPPYLLSLELEGDLYTENSSSACTFQVDLAMPGKSTISFPKFLPIGVATLYPGHEILVDFEVSIMRGGRTNFGISADKVIPSGSQVSSFPLQEKIKINPEGEHTEEFVSPGVLTIKIDYIIELMHSGKKHSKRQWNRKKSVLNISEIEHSPVLGGIFDAALKVEVNGKKPKTQEDCEGVK